MELLEALTSRVVVADGAMGTLLFARGARRDRCLEQLCETQPELVAQVHRDYLAAGAQFIRTHSFGANAARLAAWGLEGRVGELNWLAARLAREAVKGTEAIVAASVGPTGKGGEAGALIEEQLAALIDGGAQCVIFETFTDVDELLTALEVKQGLSSCPTVAMMARVEPTVWPRLHDAGADFVGINCAGTPVEILTALGEGDFGKVAVFPSAGLPDENGRYAVSPADFADDAQALIACGVQLIGGCCGTTPEHIATVSERLRLVG